MGPFGDPAIKNYANVFFADDYWQTNDSPVVHVWSLQEGQETRFEPYPDNATMLAALGR